MLLQKLRKRVGARLSGNSESGFTLVELLVVMLILGILAAIAIPAFFNQKQKANDAQAKEYAHSSQVAMETYATDHNGSYLGVTVSGTGGLTSYEPTLSGASIVLSGLAANSYTIEVTAPVTGNVFKIARATTGVVTYPCTVAGTGGCPSGGAGWGS
jgi:type IV pilus assembly protein PilA